jgi:hypothetical protein
MEEVRTMMVGAVPFATVMLRRAAAPILWPQITLHAA